MMDPDVSLLLHCGPWRGLQQSQVQVELSERFNRQSDAALERHIEEVWTARVTKEPWLFNGAKFRLHSFQLAPPPSLPSAAESSCRTPSCQDSAGGERTTSEPARVLTLRVGLTSYKDYLGTNWSWRVAELCRRGEADFSSRQALLAQPLGVGAVMCTGDRQVVLIRRSQKVAEAGGKLDMPGGHPEPKAVCQSLGEENINMTLLEKSPEAVVSELFSSVCAEIRDEVNVPLSSLGEPLLMGVALNHSSAGRPSIEFHVRCSLSSAEVKELYWKGGAEANESTDVVFLSTAEVLGLDSSSPLWSELCPSAKGAVLLYQTVTPHV
ncbi:uridine diphosphate glucose pyrophosphatase NUDT22 isoform X1 [Nerophis lumbriciformis]|uniref:uridine diphosphate glucose pyrophosphatase NUDT22 isoform X1 n=1 Tax=Nerophis lumbriciformis TaxID=546530 RepID=UPI002ADFD69A|nr:uridine diphosphate glucose pyrophosphatase NUDT22-like isoform X1 [Nerophis lumbriciformis]XP_061786478.1 uridine diphosphate glucose pyrophosphatase NUDT22-like isoform X1 [Nerophis lumbriciformis]XP_061786479.1 uridine diphosphate glucose pyrophosphatase NUDT22-like isoform X1 [Nerophis lumbriciformis]XP_061786480.1 uridine diphosphate glucose pyrophosphatase NUDT22-like isoform X1 [Nerophis lumbriciformis]